MPRDRDSMMREIAARQHGLLTRAQLLAAGLTAAAVDGRVRTGRLRLVQRGVYRLAAASPREREMAAVLGNPGAVVSHRSAAFLWGLLPEPATVEIIVRRHHGDRPGIIPRRAVLEPDEVTTLDHIPITTPARTIVDLAGVVSHRELEQAIEQARRLGLPIGDLPALMARHAKRAGNALLRKVMEGLRRMPMTRSEAERRLLRLIRKARLPLPDVNAMVAGFEVDFLWRDQRLIVEVDGFAYHSSRAQFESDRRRDGELVRRGFRVIRITWQQIAQEPEATVALLAQALAS